MAWLQQAAHAYQCLVGNAQLRKPGTSLRPQLRQLIHGSGQRQIILTMPSNLRQRLILLRPQRCCTQFHHGRGRAGSRCHIGLLHQCNRIALNDPHAFINTQPFHYTGRWRMHRRDATHRHQLPGYRHPRRIGSCEQRKQQRNSKHNCAYEKSEQQIECI